MAPAANGIAMKAKKPRSMEGREEAKAAATMTSEEWKKLQAGMAEKWPQPVYMSKAHKGSPTNYRDETYEIITRWTAETKITYRPHAKSPGSKSHVRYEVYSKAKTVGQALKHGSWPADWCWDYERGFIKVHGPVRDEPLDISRVTEEKKITDVDRAIWRWYLRELAKMHGLSSDQLRDSCSGESLIMRAHRLVAQREARKRLESAEREKRLITDDELCKTLQEWAFAKNVTRVNVLPNGKDWVWSDTMGLLRDRVGDIHLTPTTRKYPEVVAILNKWLRDRLPADVAEFKWTSINLNCDYAAKLHRDGNNFGPSFIKAFGDFKHGELSYWPEDDRKEDKLEDLKDTDKVQVDLKNGLALFNGNCGHAVSDFEGNRLSVVYFTVGCYDKAPQECKDRLSELGMNYPPQDADRYALLKEPRGYTKKSSGKTAAGKAKIRSYGYWPCAKLESGKKAFPLLKVVEKCGASGVSSEPASKSPKRKPGAEEPTAAKGGGATKTAAKAKPKAKGKAKAKAVSARVTPARPGQRQGDVTPRKPTAAPASKVSPPKLTKARHDAAPAADAPAAKKPRARAAAGA